MHLAYHARVYAAHYCIYAVHNVRSTQTQIVAGCYRFLNFESTFYFASVKFKHTLATKLKHMHAHSTGVINYHPCSLSYLTMIPSF